MTNAGMNDNCDPFAGLDSSSANVMVSVLKSLACSGRIVLFSLHQPSPQIFGLLDKTIVLSQGFCVYNGRPSDARDYMERMGRPCAPDMNIAEHIIECSRDSILSETMKAGSEINSNKSAKPMQDQSLEEFDANLGQNSSEDMEMCNVPKPRPVSFVTELATLTWRTGIDMIRNPALVLLHWGLALGMGIFTGCVFWQVGFDTSGAQNRAGGIIFTLSFFAFSSLTTVDLIFHEKRVVASEVRGGYYRPWTYFVSKLVLDGILLRFIPTLLYTASFYNMMGLPSASDTVALFLMVLGTFAIAVGALSLAVTVASGTAGQASFIMNVILLVSLLNSGFFVNMDTMPDWISWLHYLSIIFYAYNVLAASQISSLLFNFVVRDCSTPLYIPQLFFCGAISSSHVCVHMFCR